MLEPGDSATDFTLPADEDHAVCEPGASGTGSRFAVLGSR